MSLSSSQRLLFAPPNGHEYKDNDWAILCKETPIPLYRIPEYFLVRSLVPDLDPPVLWCGWAVGQKKLLELAERRHPNDVLYDDDASSDDGEVINPTLFDMEDWLREEFEIPKEMQDCLLVTNVRFPEGHCDYALVVGNNHMGIIPPMTDIIDRIADELFDGEEPGWYLAPQRWRWTRKKRSRCVPPKKETPNIVATTATAAA